MGTPKLVLSSGGLYLVFLCAGFVGRWAHLFLCARTIDSKGESGFETDIGLKSFHAKPKPEHYTAPNSPPFSRVQPPLVKLDLFTWGVGPWQARRSLKAWDLSSSQNDPENQRSQENVIGPIRVAYTIHTTLPRSPRTLNQSLVRSARDNQSHLVKASVYSLRNSLERSSNAPVTEEAPKNVFKKIGRWGSNSHPGPMFRDVAGTAIKRRAEKYHNK
ncbi:hypothetical protein B0H13DRAFT_2453067 [Mycena leptocephala]|nr:hypothetical protein B0H13DRAFT_2453067 [Mycena leptocephala]